jgi:hypothetical protein
MWIFTTYWGNFLRVPLDMTQIVIPSAKGVKVDIRLRLSPSKSGAELDRPTYASKLKNHARLVY